MKALMPNSLTEYLAVAVSLAAVVGWLSCWLQA